MWTGGGIELTRDGLVGAIYGVNSLGRLIANDHVVRMDLSSHAFRAMNAPLSVRPVYVPRMDQW